MYPTCLQNYLYSGTSHANIYFDILGVVYSSALALCTPASTVKAVLACAHARWDISAVHRYAHAIISTKL